MRASEKAGHMARVRDLGCVLSRSHTDVVLHHARGGSIARMGINIGGKQKASDYLVLPLLPHFHTGDQGIHQIGVQTWERKFGTQVRWLLWVSDQLEYDVFERALNNDRT